MTIIQERYQPKPIAANGTLVIGNQGGGGADGIAGFVCEVSGTLTINSRNQHDSSSTTILAVAVTAGTYLPMPMSILGGSTVVLSGGAKGLLLVF